MSSELIGELGQVGLTIGEPVGQPTEDEENHIVDDGISDDSAVSGPELKRSRVSSSRPKTFRHEWMNFDIFKDWLRPHQNPELASCSVCNRAMKAGKSELEKHATGKRHLQMLKEQQQSLYVNADTAADLDAVYNLDGWCEQNEQGTGKICEGKTVRKHPSQTVDTALSEERIRRVKGISQRKVQRYRKAWETIPEFTMWLTSHPSPYKAICKLCDKILCADVTGIRQHGISRKHLLAEQRYYESRQQAIWKGLSRVDGEDDDDETEEISRADTGGTSGNDGVKQQFIMYRDIEHPYTADNSAINDDSMLVDEPHTAGLYIPVQDHRASIGHRASTGHRASEARNDVALPRLFVTKPAPPWRSTAIVNGHVTRLDMNDYKGRYIVLFFYAHNFSKVDASEINRLSDRVSEFRSVHAEIVACSTDSHLSHLTWAKKGRGEGGVQGVKIPLIADPTHVISKQYGVYIKEKGQCLRAHFIIDRRGILRHMAINDPLIGRGTDEILRIVKALQFSDQVEEPLVADWTPPVHD